jgi:hypothetical protein
MMRVKLCALISIGLMTRVIADPAPGSLTTTDSASPPSLRIAVVATTDGKPDPNLGDTVAALLSQRPEMEVYERGQIAQLLNEDVLDRSLSDPAERSKLGHFLALDYYVTVRTTTATGRCDLQIVDALSGKLAANGSVASGGPDIVAAFADTLLTSQRTPHATIGNRSVAVIDFSTPDNADVRQQAQAESLSEQLRESLAASHLTVLDRMFSEHVVQEQLLHQDGLSSDAKAAPLLGADYVVYGEIADNEIQLHILCPGTSHEAGTQSFPLVLENNVSHLSQEAISWLIHQIQPEIHTMDWIEPTLQPEALQPYYEGLGAFQAGRYFDAIDRFTEAYRLNDQFREAYEWEARCYDALGLPGLGDAERRYVAKDLADRAVSRPVAVRQSEGITFVGLDGDGFPPLEIKHYEMLAIDAFSSGLGVDLHLPSDLARFRDEYDLFVGIENSRGTTWASTPNFLTRWSLQGRLSRDASGAVSVSWMLSDTLSLSHTPEMTSVLPNNPPAQRKMLADSVRQLVARDSHPGNSFSQLVGLVPVTEAAPHVGARGAEGNRALLQVALQAPADPALWGHELDKNGYDKRGLQGFLNFALRDYLISRLPAENLYRQWLEITQFARSIPFKEVGQFYSGKKIDVYAGLELFTKDHPQTITGCFAEYMLLYDRLSTLPPDELERQLQNLRTKLSLAQDAHQVEALDKFEGAIDHLIVLAKLARGQKDETLSLPNDNFPHRLFPELFPHFSVQFYSMDGWTCDEWKAAGNPEWLDQQDEAQAALLILGRRVYNRVLDPAWLKAHPHSVVMLGFAIQNVYAVNHGTGRPILHPFDQSAEQKDFQEVVAYCEHGLTEDLAKSTNLVQEHFFEEESEQFVCYLCNFAFGSTIDDNRFDRIRSDLASAVEAARHRLDDVDFKKESLIWMRMPRLFPSPDYFNDVNTEDAYYDPGELLAYEQEAGARSWATSPVQDLAWTKIMDYPFFMKKLPPDALAKILQRYESRMDALFDNRPLSEKDAGFVLDFALMLLHAHDFPAAEKWLRAVANQPETETNRSPRFTDYRANALLHLGFVLMALGREAEAPPLLKQAIGLTDNGFVPVMERVHGYSSVNPLYQNESGGVRSMAMRLLEDARLDILPDELPPNVKRISISVPKLGYLKVDYYVRIPKGYDSKGSETHRILIIAPPLNGATPDYCLDQNAWAQFADRHGLFLVAPQFLALFDDRMNTFLNPQEWSGESTLQVVDQLAAQYRVDKNKLLLHGYGGGGDFVNRFARWAPDRVAAASSHSTVGWDYYEVTPGLHPLGDLGKVAQLITCGEEDSFPVNSDDRLNRGIQYCTALKGSRCPFIWKAWPDTAYEINPDMERLAQAFLAYYAINPLGPPRYIGDLRQGTYVSADDSRATRIPERWRQPLPNQEIANLWGRQE